MTWGASLHSNACRNELFNSVTFLFVISKHTQKVVKPGYYIKTKAMPLQNQGHQITSLTYN